MEFNGTFIATIPTFILFVFLMNKVLYAPILQVMTQRESFIKANYDEAQENRQKVKELTEERDITPDGGEFMRLVNEIKALNVQIENLKKQL